MDGGELEYLAECFWPGVAEEDLRALDERAATSAQAISAGGRRVRYRGSLLMREDEVVLCLFSGSLEAVREAAEGAQVPFDRIVETDRSPRAVANADV